MESHAPRPPESGRSSDGGQQRQTFPSDNAAEAKRARALMARELRQFAGSTTAHGFRHLNHPILAVQVAWLALIAAAFAAFTCHLSLLAVKYREEPITTKIIPRGSRYNTPDVTICNKMMFAISKVFSWSPGHGVSISEDFLTLFNSVQILREILNASVRRYLRAEHGSYERNADLLRVEDDGVYNLPNLVIRDTFGIKTLSRFSAHAHTMLLWCNYGTLACDHEDFQPLALPAYPACMTFSLQRFRSRRPKQNVSGLSELRIVLFTDSFNSEPFVTASLLNLPGEWFNMQSAGGVVAFVHLPGTYPTQGNRIEASNGEETIVDIGYQEYKAKSTQHVRCLDDASHRLLRYLVIGNEQLEAASFQAQQQDCHVAVSQDVLLGRCGFIDPSLPIPADLIDAPRRGNLSMLVSDSASSVGATPAQLILRLHRYFNSTNRSDGMPGIIQRLLKNETCLRQAQAAAATDPRIDQCLEFCRGGFYTTSFMSNTWPVSTVNFLQPTVKRWLESNVFYLNGSSRANQSVNEAFILVANWNLYKSYKMLHSDPAAGGKNFLAMRFRVGDTHGLGALTEESWAYQLQDLASDIGGILGLYMGVSVLTLCEILELVARLISGTASGLRLASPPTITATSVSVTAEPSGPEAGSFTIGGGLSQKPHKVGGRTEGRARMTCV